jgi:glycogen operon protein
MRHLDVPVEARGTLAGLSHPAAIDHLVRLGVSHVELMPVAAWMDERHLPPLGLTNAWGYNPVCFMALDPRLAPAGTADLRQAVAALHEAGIAVLLDVVFNHTAESDALGTTVSLRGLDNAVYYRHAESDPGRLVNDTGCGNTLACDRAPVVRLVMDSLRHFVEAAGIDGFRFDLATALGRTASGFSAEAPLLAAIAQDPVLRGLRLIAEPWDVGPGGYRLGGFPAPWLEWNDRYRDDVRKFWRGDPGAVGALATRLAGSADIFAPSRRSPSASVNFIATHDGFTLRDLVSYEHKHNAANGEDNRDGTDANFSWNNGCEGGAGDTDIDRARDRDLRALLATLLISRGTPMLTAGDEFGRTQGGNNNAYAQDNETTWLDWAHADRDRMDFVARLMRLRGRLAAWHTDRFLTGQPVDGLPFPDVMWLRADGGRMEIADWKDEDFLALLFCTRAAGVADIERVYVAVNRAENPCDVTLPAARQGFRWTLLLDSGRGIADDRETRPFPGRVEARTVMTFVESADPS